MRNAHALIDRIQALPPDRVAEIQHFVGFITALEQERLRLSGAAIASKPAFVGIWNSPEDDILHII